MLWQLRSCIFLLPDLLLALHTGTGRAGCSPAAVGCPTLEERSQGFRLWESTGRTKAGRARLPQLFHAPGNWTMLGVTPHLNFAHLPINPWSLPQPRLYFRTSFKSLPSCGLKKRPSPFSLGLVPPVTNPLPLLNTPLLFASTEGGCTGIPRAKEE